MNFPRELQKAIVEAMLFTATHPLPSSAFLRPQKATLLRRVAAELPGIGFDRARNVEDFFGSIESMFWAGEDDWKKIEGIGKVTAQMAWEALHGKKERDE